MYNRYLLLLTVIFCHESNATYAGWIAGDSSIYSASVLTIQRNSLVKIDSTAVVKFSGKEAAKGSIIFGAVAAAFNAISALSSSMEPAGFAFMFALLGLILGIVSRVLSARRKGRVQFKSLKEYRTTKKRAVAGILLSVLGIVAGLLLMAAFLTFTMSGW